MAGRLAQRLHDFYDRVCHCCRRKIGNLRMVLGDHAGVEVRQYGDAGGFAAPPGRGATACSTARAAHSVAMIDMNW